MVTKYTMTLKSHIQRKNNDTRRNMKKEIKNLLENSKLEKETETNKFYSNKDGKIFVMCFGGGNYWYPLEGISKDRRKNEVVYFDSIEEAKKQVDMLNSIQFA